MFESGCRISDEWTYQDLQALVLENHLLRVVVLVGKGSDIVEFRYKPLDLDFLLHMPGGMRNPRQYTPSAYTSGAFIDYYSGGWNEVLPNGGPGVIYKGAALGQHGEISLIPWQYTILEQTAERVSVSLSVRPLRTPFYLQKTLSLERGRAVLTIEETLTNEAGMTMDLMWGQHIAFGRPFLDEGARVDVAPCRILAHAIMPDYEPRRFQPGAENNWPLLPTPDGSLADASDIPAFGKAEAQEMAYLLDLTDGWYAITNPQRQAGFGIRFDHHLYRYIWYWQQLGNVAKGAPWWGRLHTTALEPWTSFPTNGLLEAIENGSALQLAPGERIHTTLRAVAYHGIIRVNGISQEGVVEGDSAENEGSKYATL